MTRHAYLHLPRCPEALAAYEVLRPLRPGRRALLARDRSTQGLVVLKFLRPGEGLRGEGHCPPPHPNLVPVAEVGGGPIRCLRAEYVEGIDLEQLVAHARPLGMWEACHCLVEVVAGLEHLWAFGATHGRLDASHVLVSSSGAVRLLPPAWFGFPPEESEPRDDLRDLGALCSSLRTGQRERPGHLVGFRASRVVSCSGPDHRLRKQADSPELPNRLPPSD